MGKAKYDYKQVASALRKSGGVCTDAAELVGCSLRTIWNYIDRYKTCKDAREQGRKANLEVAESKLLENIRDGNQKAIEFYLNAQGRERGYGDRKIHEFEGDYQIQILPPEDSDDGDGNEEN